MPYCVSCGAQVEGGFCAKCGAPAGGPSPSAQQQAAGSVPAGSGMTDNMAAALCYALGFITGIVFLVLAPYNTSRTVRFHAFQSIFMCIAVTVIWIVLIMVRIILHAVPVLGFVFSVLIGLGYSLCAFCLWLYMMYKAYNNEKVVLPVIGALAEKQAGA